MDVLPAHPSSFWEVHSDSWKTSQAIIVQFPFRNLHFCLVTSMRIGLLTILHTNFNIALGNLDYFKENKVFKFYNCVFRFPVYKFVIGAFVGKSYTLVYFSSKASLWMIKIHNKYQSIYLVRLAHVE